MGAGAKGPHFISADSRVLCVLRPLAARHGFRCVKQSSCLGCDYGAGSAIPSKPKLAGRFGKIQLRKHRFKAIGRFTQSDRLLKSAVDPAIIYPSPVYGLDDRRLKQLRTYIATSQSGWRRGNSVTLSLHFAKAAKLDPIWDVTVSPLRRWANLMYFAMVPLFLARQTWWHQCQELAGWRFPWTHVVGPASACVLTLRRIGWVPTQADHWVDDEGLVQDLLTVHPRVICEAVERSIERWVWRTAAHGITEFVRDGAFDDVLLSLIRSSRPSKGGLSPVEVRALRSVIANGVGTQFRKFGAGFADHPYCPFCMGRFGPVLGTLFHYAWQCPAPEFIALRALDPSIILLF